MSVPLFDEPWGVNGTVNEMTKTSDVQRVEPMAIRVGHLFWNLSHRVASLVSKPTHFQRTMTVDRSPRDVYAFWRDFNNLAKATRRLVRIDVRDARHSHWTVSAPFGLKLTWNAEITIDESKHRLAWRTVAPADVPHVGQVMFHGIDDGKATEVVLAIDYRTPLGPLGDLLARFLGGGPTAFIEKEIEAFKDVLEASKTSDERQSELSGTEELLREARDVASGGAIHHPENIAAVENGHQSRAAQSAEANHILDTAKGPPNAPTTVAPKKHAKHMTDGVVDQRGRMRNHH